MLQHLLLGAALATGAIAQTNTPATDAILLRSGPKQVPLIELFTSEGCSSCPPAERWVNSLTNAAGLWTDFVPVVFHVDYWNGLGWPDRFASSQNTLRQQAYAEAWRSDSIYTPAFVLNGDEWRTPFGRSVPKPGSDAGILELREAGTNQFRVSLTPSGDVRGPFDATIAWIGGDLTTRVRRGENAGRTLDHNFVALDWATFPLNGTTPASGSVSLRRPTGADARKLGLVVWVTRRNSTRPVQSVGGWVK